MNTAPTPHPASSTRTYSSIYVASSLVVDITLSRQKREEKKKIFVMVVDNNWACFLSLSNVVRHVEMRKRNQLL